jgi:hypothetical protein
MLSDDLIIAHTRAWIEKAVIGLNLCPFAKAVYVKEQIRFVVSKAEDSATLLAELQHELRVLEQTDPGRVDTTLLIHPCVLADFFDYNDFLGPADEVIESLGLAGEIQLAGFHPNYQFAHSGPADIENFTNRSPYPMLHLLRESSIERAVALFPEPDAIFQKNIQTLRRLGHEGWKELVRTA